jgi:hypothetical protein
LLFLRCGSLTFNSLVLGDDIPAVPAHHLITVLLKKSLSDLKDDKRYRSLVFGDYIELAVQLMIASLTDSAAASSLHSTLNAVKSGFGIGA